MAEVIRMPRMSDTMEEGVIVGWMVAVGDTVEPGDVLAEVETDKATMELESYHEGVLLHIGVKEGPVPVNGILAVIGEKGEDYKAALAASEAAAPQAVEAAAPAEVAHSGGNGMAPQKVEAYKYHINTKCSMIILIWKKLLHTPKEALGVYYYR